MKIYFAGAENKVHLEKLYSMGGRNVLMSYWSIKKPERYLKIIKDKKIDVFMDCGAYSAWSRGFTIDVNDYAQFIKNIMHYINVYPNLDVKGDIPKTIENMNTLESYGLSPIPVYHLNTDNWDLLKHYIDNYPYIAVGAIAGEKNNKSILYKRLDTMFSLAKRNPVTKFHGFGLTIKDLLYRYPFYSVDSTSWIATIRFGMKFTDTKQEFMHSKLRNKDEQLEYAIKYFLELEKELTNLWTKRGIIWN